MRNVIKKIIREEIEDFDWIQNQNPEPWEEFMYPYINLKGKLKNTRFGNTIVYRDKNGDWIFYHKQNPENDYVWFNYNKIWSVFETKFELKREEIQEILGRWLGEHYNLRGVTTNSMYHFSFLWLGEHYNLRGKLQEFKNQHTSSSDHNICDVMTINSLEEILELLKGMGYDDNKSEIESILTNMEKEKKELSNNRDILNNYLRKVQNILCV